MNDSELESLLAKLLAFGVKTKEVKHAMTSIRYSLAIAVMMTELFSEVLQDIQDLECDDVKELGLPRVYERRFLNLKTQVACC